MALSLDMGLDLISYIIYLGPWNFARREILEFEINSSMADLISIMTKITPHHSMQLMQWLMAQLVIM